MPLIIMPILLLLCCQGCISTPFPEYGPSVQPSIYQPTGEEASATIGSSVFTPNLVAYSREHHHSEPFFLGHQFVLAFIPLTSLQITDSINYFFLELLLQAAQQSGYTTWRANLHGVDAAKSLMPRMMKVRLGKPEMEITAWDAILLRIITLKFGCTLHLEGHCGQSAEVTPAAEQNHFTSRAHLPLLAWQGSNMIRQEMRRVLDQNICSQLPSFFHHSAADKFILVSPTFFTKGITPDLREAINNSWGFMEVTSDDRPASETSRLLALQRGLETSLFKLPYPVLSLRSSRGAFSLTGQQLSHSTVLNFETTVTGMELSDGNLKFSANWAIERLSPDGGTIALSNGFVSDSIRVDTGVEGDIYRAIIRVGEAIGKDAIEKLDRISG